MVARLNIDSIHCNQIRILFVFGFNSDLAGERKGSPWFKGKRRVSHSNWFWIAVSHIDIESYLLNNEVFWLFDKQFPDVLFFCFCENGLLSLQRPWDITDFNVDYAFHHCLDFEKIAFSPTPFLIAELCYKLLMKLFVFCLFGNFSPTKRTFLVDQQRLQDTLIAEKVAAIRCYWSIQNFVTDCTPMLLL